MARLPRFGSAVSAVALASVIAACAAPLSQGGSAMKGRNSNLALALRAQMAIGAGDLATGVDLAERAVENSPRDANVRALLANAYFASGRFASAEAAYRDTLTLAPNQPQVVLKLALVQVAQGKNSEALALLESARGFIDPADHGLALALAGQPYEAIQVLEVAARATGADARVRQNLALAYALSGDWTAARTIAAQDLSPDLVDARVQQWMALSRPARASDQVAALVGVTSAVSDPGQPVRLALSGTATRIAQMQSEPVASAPQAGPVPQAGAVEFGPAFAEPVSPQPFESPALPAPVAVAAAPELAPQPQPAASPVAAVAAMAAKAPAALAAMVSNFAPAPKPRAASAPKKKAASRPAVQREAGKANAVVQLGAYSSAARVSAAWAQLSARYATLRGYTPSSARFNGPRGTVYRLSVKGFASMQEASGLCSSLRQRGANCFVRKVAGDAPVRIASR